MLGKNSRHGPEAPTNSLLDRIATYGDSAGAGLAAASASAFVLFLIADFGGFLRARPPAVALAALLFVVLSLNARRVRRCLAPVRRALDGYREHAYWIVFGVLMSLSVVSRVCWTIRARFPEFVPDSDSYLIPALSQPWFPLSEIRPIGVPAFLAFANIFIHHPIGILALHNLLAIGSAAALAIVIKRKLNAPVLSLLAAGYVLLLQKNIAFEYLLLSEHLARCLYLLWAVVVVLYWRQPRVSVAVSLAVLSIANVLVKQSALVLLPAFALVYGLARARSRGRQASPAHVVTYFAVTLLVLAAYAGVFRSRYGRFDLSSLTGWALYGHVGHLTDLESEKYPEIKVELRRFLPKYVAKYVARHDYRPDWIVYGVDEELSKDFGSWSPAAVVRSYAQRYASRTLPGRMNEIYLDLAVEGILKNPAQYLSHAMYSAYILVRRGLTVAYRQNWPLGCNAELEIASSQYYEARYRQYGGYTALLEGAGPRLAKTCGSILDETPRAVSSVSGKWLPVGAWLALFFMPVVARPVGASEAAILLRSWALAMAVVVVLYVLLLGLLGIAEPPRFMANVQDLIALSVLSVLALEYRISPLWMPRSGVSRQG